MDAMQGIAILPAAATGFPSHSFVAVNHFLDPLEKGLQFEVAIVPLAIDKKCRRAVYDEVREIRNW